MLHSGSILRMVGSSTYSYCNSWCILALSTLTDTFTFSKPSSEAVVLQTMCLVDLLWVEASKYKQDSARNKLMRPQRDQTLLYPVTLIYAPWGGETHCYRNMLWIAWCIYLRNRHSVFSSLNKSEKANISQVSEWNLIPKGSPNQISLQKYFCVIKYLMDVSFLLADICISSS